MKVTNIYDDVKTLYDLLRGDDLNSVKRMMEHLKLTHGLDKHFIAEMLKTVAYERIVSLIYDEIEPKRNALKDQSSIRK